MKCKKILCFAPKHYVYHLSPIHVVSNTKHLKNPRTPSNLAQTIEPQTLIKNRLIVQIHIACTPSNTSPGQISPALPWHTHPIPYRTVQSVHMVYLHAKTKDPTIEPLFLSYHQHCIRPPFLLPLSCQNRPRKTAECRSETAPVHCIY
jgi:hypothetical protein